MDDDIKRKLILFSGFVCIGVVLYLVFVGGASYGCSSGNGTLLDSSSGMRCLDLSSVDVCRDHTGRVIKSVDKFNFTVNVSGDGYGW
jgi:hypothetical protein